MAALPSLRARRAPVNPAAWLTTAAKNYARDAARRRRIVDEKAPLLVEERDGESRSVGVHPRRRAELDLHVLPSGAHPGQSGALTLKVVAGFSTEESARAFLAPEKTIAQRIVRAKKVFGLFALISFSFARAHTRTDDRGELLLLSEQDPSRWDRPAIKKGLEIAPERLLKSSGTALKCLRNPRSVPPGRAPKSVRIRTL